jgi:hypothetical protein
VTLKGDHVVIRDLIADGAVVELVRNGVAQERDPEQLVRHALEVGAAVLLHGTAKGTVDAVSAEVDRLLVAMRERSERLEAVRRQGERIAAKGFTFEDELGPALDACYAPHEDIVEVTGAAKGIADDKVGDFVVTLNPRDTGGRDRRIVFEAKDRAVSMKKGLDELDAALLNRDAHVAVMVFAHARQAPLAGKPLRVLPGNRLMVVWEVEENGGSELALEVCAQLARALAITAQREDLTLDRGALAEKLAALTNVVERGSDIRRGIRSARRGLDVAEDAYLNMTEEALALLLELQERL